MIHIELDNHTKFGWVIEVKRWLDGDDVLREDRMTPTFRGLDEYKKKLREMADQVPKEQRHTSDHYCFGYSLPPQARF